MIKRFFLAAIAAMTLSLGFTSCSDDDDNANKLNVTYQLRFRNDNAESTYLSKVVAAYKSKVGLADDETVTIWGTSRDECDSLLALKVISAVDQIKNVEWEDTTFVEIYVKGNDKCIFQDVYAPASNGDEFAGFEPVATNARLYTDDIGRPETSGIKTEAITNVHVELHESKEERPFYNKYYTINLNSGNGGKYVYITFDACDPKGDYVTDLVVAKPKNGVVEPTIQWKGRTYYVCDSEEAKNNNSYACVSLNAGTNGEPYYLYYTKEKVGDERISTISTIYTKNWAVEYNTNVWGKLYWVFNQSFPVKKRYLEYNIETIDEEALAFMKNYFYGEANALIDKIEGHGSKIYDFRWGEGRVLEVVSDSDEPEYCCTNKGALGFNIYLYLATKVPNVK